MAFSMFAANEVSVLNYGVSTCSITARMPV